MNSSSTRTKAPTTWPIVLAMLVVVLTSDVAVAQIIDPYRRVTDPRAIVDLAGDDSEPLRHRARYGLPPEKDENDYHILAQDSGAGIISHIWATADFVDSTTDIRIYIDGQQIISSTFRDFFLVPRGMFRPPLDTALAGGWVNDVQMPYRTSFRIVYRSPSYNFYYAISWRRIKDAAKLKSFKLYPTASDASFQVEAEKRMLATGSPWDPSTQDSIKLQASVRQSERVTLAVIDGPAMIQELEFDPVLKDPLRFRNLFLKIYFDGNPYPAVDAPLYDFFLSSTKYKEIGALSIKVKTDGPMVCYLPMPFAQSCRIVLESHDTAVADLAVRIAYSKEGVDRRSQGYFHAVFHESNPTRLGVFHPVLHTRGRGRLVGLSHHIPNLFFPVALEGDPVIAVDSAAEHFVRYTGGEDYYNGGWWFVGTLYSRPFAGFHTWFDGFYRFHHLDAMDFNVCFDFDMQHGVNNDVHDHYRTVAYYYKQWTPFWTSRDTVRIGEPWDIHGTGYTPLSPILISISGVIVDSITADSKGSFSRRIYMPGRVKPGKHLVKVNLDEKPEWLYVIGAPAIRAISDRLIPVLRERDTLLVTGTGFQVGEKVSLFLDSIRLQGEFVVDSDFRFFAVVRMPYLPDHEYHLVAIGERSGQAIAPYPVKITRVQNFEFEQLLPALDKSEETARRDNVSFFYHDKWSQQSFVYFEAFGRDSFITFAIDVARTDTFDVFIFATQGRKFGNYEFSINGEKRGEFDGYRNHNHYDPWRSDTLRAGTLFLEEGIHTVTFKCLGKHDSAEFAWLGADNIVLRPTHPLPVAPGTWTGSTPLEVRHENGQLQIFPNPGSDLVNLSISISEQDTDVLIKPAFLTIIDGTGRTHSTQWVNASELSKEPLKFNTQELPPGRYFVSLVLSGTLRTLTLSSALNILR